MKNIMILSLLSIGVSISGCSKIPSACNEVWNKIESVAKDSGIPKEAIKVQKEQFMAQIESMPKKDASRMCEEQSDLFN